eukprot:Nk52_evm2s1444 gene=Nk52_evmTU2s1444
MPPHSYNKLEVKAFPRLANRKTAENRYWNKFKFPIVVKEFGPISHLEFSPVAPHDFAVTSSSRLQVYNPNTNTVKKTIARFNGNAYSCSYRNDGQLMVAGGEEALVQIFDANSRAILRTFKGHEEPVHVTRFMGKEKVMSASDDKTVKIWDVARETETISFDEHRDYVRAGAVNRLNTEMVLTGGYDHIVKLWDCRSEECAIEMDHCAPVESVLFLAGGNMCVSAGGNEIKVWDLLQGGKLLKTMSNHQKTVTSLCMDNNQSRLISGSLDQQVKIYDVVDYKVVHSINYTAPVLSVGVSPDDTHLIAGMTNGYLSIKKRVCGGKEQMDKVQAKDAIRNGSYRYFVRGKRNQADENAFKVESGKKQHLKPYDQSLKKFQYHNALNQALPSQRPAVIVSLFDELMQRDGLKIALSGRDEASLEPVLSFLIRNVTNPRYTHILINVTNVLMDIYAPIIGQSVHIDEMFTKLQRKVDGELNFQKKMCELLGSLDLLFSSSSASRAV